MARRKEKKADTKQAEQLDPLSSDFLGVDELNTDELNNADLGAWEEKQIEEEAEEEAVTDEDQEAPGQLAVDVFESKENLFVRARVAGVTKDNLEVTLSDNVLTIAGSLQPDGSDGVTGYFTQECYWGQFIRTIALPVQVKEEDVSADLKEGVLTVQFIKVKQDIVRKIAIN